MPHSCVRFVMPDGTPRQLVFEKGATLSKVKERVSHAFGVGQHVKLDCGADATFVCIPTGMDNVKVVPLVAPRTLCDVIPTINATPFLGTSKTGARSSLRMTKLCARRTDRRTCSTASQRDRL